MLVIRSLTSYYCKSPDILFNHLQLFQKPWMCLYALYYLPGAAPITLAQMTEKQWEANVLWSGKKTQKKQVPFLPALHLPSMFVPLAFSISNFLSSYFHKFH